MSRWVLMRGLFRPTAMMNRSQPQEDNKAPEPLREYGYGPVFLLFYLSLLLVINSLLIGQEKKPVISC